MKKVIRFLLSPSAPVFGLLVVQFSLLAWIFIRFGLDYTAAFLALMYLSMLLGIILFDKAPSSPTYKLMWLWLFMLLPLLGELLYFIWGRPGLFKKKEKHFAQVESAAGAAMRYSEQTLQQLQSLDRGLACQAKYLQSQNNPLYSGCTAEYFGSGEKLLPVLMSRLEKAESTIWMEYFIYNIESSSWQQIEHLLRKKAADGVDVRIIYDAVGCLMSLPADYPQQLRKAGITCYRFNPLHFSLHIRDYGFINHRDHRKLCIIDGKVAFTGGVNMADEYFGLAQPYGVWKDASLMIIGPAVQSFCATFLKMWQIVSRQPVSFSMVICQSTPNAQSFCQPFDDTPLDTETVSQNAYMNVLHHAHRYVWITTPYLIPDHELIEALCLVAKSGVDVRIITPGIPDKKQVFLVTRSYYRQLLEGGVRIYEYQPGFVHSKLYLCDDKIAIVGSANMDYRSLYLHFENCCALYGGEIIRDIRQDFLDTFALCNEIMPGQQQFGNKARLLQIMLRFFAPLL